MQKTKKQGRGEKDHRKKGKRVTKRRTQPQGEKKGAKKIGEGKICKGEKKGKDKKIRQVFANRPGGEGRGWTKKSD